MSGGVEVSNQHTARKWSLYITVIQENFLEAYSLTLVKSVDDYSSYQYSDYNLISNCEPESTNKLLPDSRHLKIV